MKDFNNAMVFIPGGSSGIGLSAARILGAKGANVVIFARDRKRLEEAAAMIEKSRKNMNQRVGWMQLDVSDNAAVKRIMDKAVLDFGVPELLINCVGRAYPKKFEDVSFEQFDETMRVNMYGIWNTCAALVPYMKEHGGAIVNISSIAGFVGIFGYTDYSASKFAVIGFSETLKSELKQFGITVQVLCPPDTDTPGLEVENRTKPEETKAISAAAKVMSADEVAKDLLMHIRKGTFVIIPGLDGKVAFIAKRLFPRLVENMMDRDIRKARGKTQ